MGKRIKSLKGSQCCEGMHFGGKTGCIEKMFVKLEMTRASPGSSLVHNKGLLQMFQTVSQDLDAFNGTPDSVLASL